MAKEKIALGRYAEMYSTQPWFDREVYIFRGRRTDVPNTPPFGPEAHWENLRTGEIHSAFEYHFVRIEEPEASQILREHKLENLFK
jgi:hypothetical protein